MGLGGSQGNGLDDTKEDVRAEGKDAGQHSESMK